MQTIVDPMAATVTSILDGVRRGDTRALARLVSLARDKLLEIARIQSRHQPSAEALTTTALVHDAFTKLFGSDSREGSDRAHFMSVAATAMRQILIGHARRSAARREAGAGPASFDDVERALEHEPGFIPAKADALLALDRALDRLHQHSYRQSRVAECRLFGGMSIDETATALDIPPDAVSGDWAMAQTWLHREIQRDLGSSHEHSTSDAHAFFDRLAAVLTEAGHDAAQAYHGASTQADTAADLDVDPMIGTTVAHYEIVARIGQGGMGRVYRAVDVRLRRPVALKLLRRSTTNDLRAKERLLEEARAAAALDHTNICTIHEVGETSESLPYIAMAFYSGETLKQTLQRGALPLSATLGYATQIARALDAAHKRSIIHRDVKPANIIVTAEGVVKLLDFGIAHVLDVTASQGGVTAGTVAYMSPEQVTSRPLDQRTDLWSLGVVLYEMCTGVRPFRADSTAATLEAILNESPLPVSARRRELPAYLDAIIGRLLAKDPDQRYPSADQLISDLMQHSSITSPASATTLPTARPFRAAARFGAAAVVVGALIMTRHGTPSRTQSGHMSDRRMAAIDLFAQGNREVLFRTDSGRRQVLDFFRRAVEADSTYAPAQAGLAHALVHIGEPAGGTTRERIAAAEQAARTAIVLDSTLADAHAALGHVLLIDYQFERAEEQLRRATDLDPRHSGVREFLIRLYIFTGRPRDALREAERSAMDNPESPVAIADVARALLINDRCDEALERLDRLMYLRPPPARAAHIAAVCYGQRQMWQKAVDVLRPMAAANARANAWLGFMLARAGRTEEAQRIRDQLVEAALHRNDDAFPVAVIYAGLREFDKAFEWLDRSIADRSMEFEIMEPAFQELHRDPRFDRVRQQLGIQRR
jgi:RNA polymerase sigma factor (TIGR02999 family)